MYILVCQVNSKSIGERILYIFLATDYGHMMTKFFAVQIRIQIEIQIPIASKYLGF